MVANALDQAAVAATERASGAGNIEISEQQIRQYEEDGAICLRGLFDADIVQQLRDATATALTGEVMSMSRLGDRGTFVGDINLFHKNPAFRSFAFEGPSWAIAKKIMRAAQVRLFSDQLFVKEPGAQARTPWHHDQTYWPVLGDQVCSVWVTMDPVTRESSGLEYVKGSHRWGRRFQPENFGEVALTMLHEQSNETIPDISAHRDEYEFLSWDMQPGDCLVHHSLAVHGASGNGSAIRRRAISTRWFGEQAFFRPTMAFSVEALRLAPGAPMTSPMFPVVPPTGEPLLPWPARPPRNRD